MPIGQVVVKLIYEGNCKSDPKSDESDLSMKAFVLLHGSIQNTCVNLTVSDSKYEETCLFTDVFLKKICASPERALMLKLVSS